MPKLRPPPHRCSVGPVDPGIQDEGTDASGILDREDCGALVAEDRRKGKVRSAARGIYAVFGTLALLAGIVALLRPAIILPDVHSQLTAHLIREEAACFVFVGLMFFWCLGHFDERRPVHLALLTFTVLFAGIHWADYVRDLRHVSSPLVNTAPVIILGVTAPWRAATDRVAMKA